MTLIIRPADALRDDEYLEEISQELEGYGLSQLRIDAAVLGPYKPDRWTYFMNAVHLYATSAIFFTLALRWSGAGTILSGTLWAIPLLQRRPKQWTPSP